MNIQEHIELLIEIPEYMIDAYVIDELNVILFVYYFVPAQIEITNFICGKEVKIVKSL